MRILIAYETGHGTTEEIANVMGEVLREFEVEVDVARCRNVKDASGYDGYIVGSPIWAFKWLKPATIFVKKNANLLRAKPTAFFMTSGAAHKAEGKAMAEKEWVPNIANTVEGLTPIAFGNFAGCLSYPKYNLPMRLMMVAIAKRQGEPTSGIVDHRNWDEIRTWTRNVYDKLADQSIQG